MPNLSKRFWSKVDVRRPNDCWNWIAARNPAGYGVFGINNTARLAHRVAWTLTYSTTPKGLCVLHKCDSPSCVNPKHLFLGTRADNITDAVKKGRMARGEDLPQAKLTGDQVTEIRARYKAGNITIGELATEYNISRRHMGRITRGKRWKHLLRKGQ